MATSKKPAEPKTTGARRVLGYARVSSEDQAGGSSLGDQEEVIRRYAESLGLTVTRIYTEAKSSLREKFEHREMMQALMADFRRGDLILVSKIDRWSRDPEFTYKSVREIIKEGGASFYAVEDACDPSTDAGDTMLNFRVLFAKEEAKRIRERMVGTRQLLLDKGYYTQGLPPYGYKRSMPKGTKGLAKNILIPDGDKADVAKRIFSLAASRSLSQIVEATGVSLYILQAVIPSRVYLGQVKNSKGEWITGQHDPLVSDATWQRAQEGMERRRLGGPRPSDAPARTSNWILRDVATCAHCGARMSASYGGKTTTKGKTTYTRYYYRCVAECNKVRPKLVRVQDVETRARGIVMKQLKELRSLLSALPSAADLPKPRPTAEVRKRLQKKRANYIEAFSNDVIVIDEMKRLVAAVDGELQRLDAERDLPARSADPRLRRAALADVRTLEKAMQSTNSRDTRRIMDRLATSVAIGNDGEGGVIIRPTWKTVEELTAVADILVGALEGAPPDIIINMGTGTIRGTTRKVREGHYVRNLPLLRPVTKG